MKVKELKEFLNQEWVKDDMTVSIFDEYSRYLKILDVRYNAYNILLIKEC
jgi:hypothetical protein